MKIPYLFKVHQISSNLQNLLESSSETCMWNLSPFGEVKIFHEKMPTGPAIEILWKFHTFSKFTKFHQTYRIYWNHHLKHACEIWVHSEKLKIFHEKMPTGPAIEILWNSIHLFKVHQISSNWQNLLESSSETCMWNLSPFGEVEIFHEKMPTVPAIEILWNFHIPFQSSPNFIKLTEFTWIIIWSMHVKFESIRRS